ncbi:tripartite tricarboxylate transporter TctB family protein [Pseudalkalibacillus salsuginis]|uniref:tripartite tricarboxylate transporter TctB family protein n=1 Tax=Pseudalkalibacillus salsuginis TaxID=2910972 RepID=UPI001F3FD5CB|nr:tripartite tricarboxylate transporter TctB family protein [Pseudalkalibacillus salsuginis]MCF6411595.1 tripartite tricarboxylate transporter TctB family protein [Pseudalkalibacillus salsuginis]
MKIQKAEIALGIFSIIASVWFILSSRKFPESLNQADVGPAAFPTIISIIIIIFSVTLIISSFFNKDSEDKVEILRIKNVILSILLLLLFALGIPFLGFYVAAALFFPIMLFLASVTNWKSIVATTLLFELLAFGVFDQLLGVPLP